MLAKKPVAILIGSQQHDSNFFTYSDLPRTSQVDEIEYKR